jgi:hypothetical protein
MPGLALYPACKLVDGILAEVLGEGPGPVAEADDGLDNERRMSHHSVNMTACQLTEVTHKCPSLVIPASGIVPVSHPFGHFSC